MSFMGDNFTMTHTVTIRLLERTITCVLRARRMALPNQLGEPAWVYDKAMAHHVNMESKVLTVTLRGNDG
jgi:hypothetical protein